MHYLETKHTEWSGVPLDKLFKLDRKVFFERWVEDNRILFICCWRPFHRWVHLQVYLMHLMKRGHCSENSFTPWTDERGMISARLERNSLRRKRMRRMPSTKVALRTHSRWFNPYRSSAVPNESPDGRVGNIHKWSVRVMTNKWVSGHHFIIRPLLEGCCNPQDHFQGVSPNSLNQLLNWSSQNSAWLYYYVYVYVYVLQVLFISLASTSNSKTS